MARALHEPDPALLACRLRARFPDLPTVFFDACHEGSSDSVNRLFFDPAEVLVGRGGRFTDGLGNEDEDWTGWLLEREPRRYLAGFLGFELAWDLDSIRARRRAHALPDLWVGAFRCAAVRRAGKGWVLEGEPSKKDRMLFNNALKAGDLGDDEPEQSEVARPDRDHYVRRVEQAVQMTEDGTLFEVNYTGRLRAEWRGESMPLYRRLVRGSGATHAGAALTPEGDVLSASPERFLKAIDGVVETRPIKGTRPRYSDPMEDQKTKRELLTDEKDRAENVMIVDLMRNDLTKVCELGSVRAEEVCALESFRDVHHLVSTVKGRLDRRFSPVAALLACFPPGSCTGAPKLRAIEAIAELEENPRGPYTGTLFFSQPDGYLDSSVLIRTASKCGSEIEFGIGGAVVADSQSEAEYQEALDKGAAFIRLGEAE